MIAGTDEAIVMLRRFLGDEVDIATALSVSEAARKLDDSIDLIVCNVRFDDSRMFDFLQILRERQHRAPVVCCRVSTQTTPGTHHAIEMALEALGVAAFVDLASATRERGAAAAEALLREAVHEHLPVDQASGPGRLR